MHAHPLCIVYNVQWRRSDSILFMRVSASFSWSVAPSQRGFADAAASSRSAAEAERWSERPSALRRRTAGDLLGEDVSGVELSLPMDGGGKGTMVSLFV